MQRQLPIQMWKHGHGATGQGGAPARGLDLQVKMVKLTVLSRFTVRCRCREKMLYRWALRQGAKAPPLAAEAP